MPIFDLIVEFYIHNLWQPINRLQGGVAELLPFSLSNFFILNGLFSLLFILHKLFKYKTIRGIKLYPILSVFILILQLGGQGATPLGSSLIFYRSDLDNKLELPPIDSVQNSIQLIKSQQYFLENYQSFKDTTQAFWLKKINLWVDQAYAEVGFKKPNQSIRQVQKIKDYSGISRIIGLAYGGPAFSDPIVSEVAMASHDDYPIPFAYRLEAWVHEIAHAKGLGNELETENLTFVALLLSKDPSLIALAHHKFLIKNNLKYEIPKTLWVEWELSRELFKEARLKQPFIGFLRTFMKKINIQNSSQKYGSIENPNEFDSENKFLKTSLYFFDKLGQGPNLKD